MNAPKTKKEMFRRWHKLEFGNKIRAWSNYNAIITSGYFGNVTIRSKVVLSFKVQYNVPVEQIIDVARNNNIRLEDCEFNESAPDHCLIGQGELMINDPLGYYLFWSYEKLPMKDALYCSGKDYIGLMALGMLKAYCNPKSYDMIQELLTLYNEAVIEFGVYSKNLGEIPGHNVLVWEVRNY